MPYLNKYLHNNRRFLKQFIPFTSFKSHLTDLLRNQAHQKYQNRRPKSISKKVDSGESLSSAHVVREAIPLYRINPPPKYPALAIRRGYQGTVLLEVLVDKNGRVGDLQVFKSSGYPVLDKKALAAVKDWLFEPGMKENKTVEMWVRIPIRFQLK